MRVLFLIVACCFFSCSLFRKTNKTTANATQSSVKQMEANQLILKKAGKETQIFTYWNDSDFYQYQYIKEQIDQAKSGKVIAEEKQESKQTINTKKTEPVAPWIYVLMLLVLIGCYLIFKRFFSFG